MIQEIDIRRLQSGDEDIASRTVECQKPVVERNGNLASSSHMRSLLKASGNYFIGAYDEKRPVGFLIAHLFPRIDRDEYQVYLYEIGVDERYRRRGIGSRMIELLKQLCREENVVIKEIWVGTEHGNTSAQELYKSTGAQMELEKFREFVYSRETLENI